MVSSGNMDSNKKAAKKETIHLEVGSLIIPAAYLVRYFVRYLS